MNAKMKSIYKWQSIYGVAYRRAHNSNSVYAWIQLRGVNTCDAIKLYDILVKWLIRWTSGSFWYKVFFRQLMPKYTFHSPLNCTISIRIKSFDGVSTQQCSYQTSIHTHTTQHSQWIFVTQNPFATSRKIQWQPRS